MAFTFETGSNNGISKLRVLDVFVFADLPSFYEKIILSKWKFMYISRFGRKKTNWGFRSGLLGDPLKKMPQFEQVNYQKNFPTLM